MTISLEEMLAELPADRRERIEKRAAELIAEELSLRELRRLRKLTQTRLSKKLKIGQEGVSRIEKRTDLDRRVSRSIGRNACWIWRRPRQGAHRKWKEKEAKSSVQIEARATPRRVIVKDAERHVGKCA